MTSDLQRKRHGKPACGSACLLLALLGSLGSAVVCAGHFERVYASSNTTKLAEWGHRYEQGKGVRTNINRAIQLYCKAAKMGNATAQYRLGWIYANGRGVTRDDGRAVAWFRKAAKQNHLQSRNLLRLVRAKAKTATCPVRRATRRGTAAHPAKQEVVRLVLELAPEYGLGPELVLAVVEAESNYNPNALSPKNAQGLMQLIPETATRFGVTDVWDPEQNLRGGMAYLRWLLNYFNNDVKLALAGYNAGEAAVSRFRGIPPYDETRAYVSQIASRLNL
jgi:soluble lytic murein transglycosylase-like protein